MIQRTQPVDVISACSKKGILYPIKLQMEDESGEKLQISVEQILRRQEIQQIGAESHLFLCRGSSFNRKVLFQLQYQIRSHSWKIYIEGFLH